MVHLREFVAEDDAFLRHLEERPEVRDRIGGLDHRKIPRGYFRLVEVNGHSAGVVAVAPTRVLGGEDLEISCALLTEYEGDGVATRACSMMLDEYPVPAPPVRILACVSSDNPAGQKVALKLGFRRLDLLGPKGEIVLQRA